MINLLTAGIFSNRTTKSPGTHIHGDYHYSHIITCMIQISPALFAPELLRSVAKAAAKVTHENRTLSNSAA